MIKIDITFEELLRVISDLSTIEKVSILGLIFCDLSKFPKFARRLASGWLVDRLTKSQALRIKVLLEQFIKDLDKKYLE